MRNIENNPVCVLYLWYCISLHCCELALYVILMMNYN